MLKRIRPSVGSAHVIALLALFAALGGGYAVAFSGSGTLQKGGLKGIPTGGTYATVRTLTGIGSIKATCDSNTFEIRLGIKNSTSHALIVGDVEGALIGGNSTVAAGAFEPYDTADTKDDAVIHLSRVDASKAPQVVIYASVNELGACSSDVVNVLALNTQE